MRILINEYIKILGYSLIGLIFAYSSFYLIANIYHYQEIRKNYNKDIYNSESFQNIKSNIIKINKNIDINNDNYIGSSSNTSMIQLKNSISNCLVYLDNDYLKTLEKKDNFNIQDVDNLRGIVLNDVVNSCLIENIYYITYRNINNTNFLEDDSQLIKNTIDSLNNRLYYINRDIQNNSSIYFNSKFVNSNNYDKVGDNLNNLLDIYKESTDLILIISDKYSKEVSNNV